MAVEMGRVDDELRIYEEMGMTYQRLGQHENAIKSFKKQLELAWLRGDTFWEMAAYDNLGMQNYYIGEVGAARYYHDRMVRGKSESEQSIIRKLSNDNAHSRYEKRKLQKPPQDECLLFAGGGGGAGAASSPRPPLYSKSEEALTSKVRPCTPIHTLEMADLPSPRGKGKGDNKMYNLLPFYQEQTADAKD